MMINWIKDKWQENIFHKIWIFAVIWILIKSIAPGNILKDIYHPRCFDKKDTIKPKNKKKEKE